MNKITVTTNKKASMSDFYGIFFEDINHAADGGLYGEMIRNRAFEFSPMDNPSYQALTAWKRIEEGGASVSSFVSNKSPFSKRNPNYLILEINKTGTRAGIKNLGYNSGIAVKENESYNFSCYAKSDKPCEITVSIDNAYGEVITEKSLNITSNEWTEYSFTLTSPVDDFSAVLAVTSKQECKFCLDFVSLFPVKTYKNRKNGMRNDIAEMLADLKPKFMRFPGGCLIHDGTLNSDDRNSMYRWKNTIGAVTDRPSRRNNWRYNQSLGLGYFEYFQFCEDIGAKPLPVLPAGYNPHMEQAVPLDEMQEWIDDALDLIEFANGTDESNEWVQKRIQMGHKEPFNMKYIGIGNEQYGDIYFERYEEFAKQIHEKYPDINLVTTSGTASSGSSNDLAWNWANEHEELADRMDEHYYETADWFRQHAYRYDNYRRDTNTKVFLGEYASKGNAWYNALSEAAFMTGLERNADVVRMASYAPMFAKYGNTQWSAADIIRITFLHRIITFSHCSQKIKAIILCRQRLN